MAVRKHVDFSYSEEQEISPLTMGVAEAEVDDEPEMDDDPSADNELSPPPKKKAYNLKTESYEFMGPPGTCFMTLMLPVVVLSLYVFCNKYQCALAKPYRLPEWKELWHPLAYLLVLALPPWEVY